MKGGFYLINSDGTGLTKIGQWERNHLFNPSWSPVDNRIVGHGQENNGLFLVDLDGDWTKRVQLTAQKAEHASWSPDGNKIAYNVYNEDDKIIFVRHLPRKAPQIWIINSDGTNPRCILDPGEEGIPTAIYDDAVWDNTGTKVAVTKVILSDESWQIATFSWEERNQNI